MNKVLILYRFLPHYRVEFYKGLKSELEKCNVDLHLIYGKSLNEDSYKNDEVEIDWAQYVPNKYFRIGKVEILWQPCLKYIKDYDLIIVEGANKLVLNYYLMFARQFSRFRLGVWGHGRNLQIAPGSIRNKFKRLFLTKCDCYFAYTEGVKKYLVENGLPEKKIVVVQNAIDTARFRQHFISITDDELENERKKLGIKGRYVGVYCGGMYPEKRLDFLIDVCREVKRNIEDFEMIFIGSGIDAKKVEKAAAENAWIHYVGPKFGTDRVIYFKLATIQLMPGLVGLSILDSFALETPLVTTVYPFHSPEFEYLENGKNGIVTENNMEAYTGAIVEILKTGKYIELTEGCKRSAEKYTISAMIENFKNGILHCLNIDSH